MLFSRARRRAAHGGSHFPAVGAQGPRRLRPCARPTLADGVLRLVVRALVERRAGRGACDRGHPATHRGRRRGAHKGRARFLPSWPGSALRMGGGGVSQSSRLLLGRNRVPARQARRSVDLVDAHLAHTRLWRGFFGDPQGDWALAPPPVPREGLPPRDPEGSDTSWMVCTPLWRGRMRVRMLELTKVWLLDGTSPEGRTPLGPNPQEAGDSLRTAQVQMAAACRVLIVRRPATGLAYHRITRSPGAATPSLRTQRPTSDLASVHSRHGQPPNYSVPPRDMGGGSPPALGSRRIG